MTSKNSFWARSKENHKRRIWVWIVAVMAQLMMYVGVLTVYLSRIRMWNNEGSFRTAEEFQDALYQAAKDALGFQDNLLPVLMGLAAIIGIQGFSYLYDRRKVDLYHSVPVDKNKRFAVVYVNGIIIYLAATLVSLLIAVVMAAAQSAMNGEVMAAVGLGFLWNLLFFLVMYHTAVLAVMVTGNLFVTLCVAGALAVYESAGYELFQSMQYTFFKTVSGFYVTHNPKLSALYDYFVMTWEIKQADDIKAMAKEVLPYYGKWFILSVVVLAAAWLCYRKRPSEAAGRAIAFPKLEPVLKVAAVIPVGITVGMLVQAQAYGNTMLTAGSMVVGGVIVAATMEVIFDFDIKSLFKHLISSGVAVLGIVAIFVAFKQDLFGYDKYLPKEGELESIALCVDYYGEFWDENFNYVDNAAFTEEHMCLTDVEPVLTLAQKSQQTDPEEMGDARGMYVLYRLNSGRKVGRRFWVDFDDPGNEELMNRIVGTQEYKEGTFQIMTDQDSFDMVTKMTYSNGAAVTALPTEDARALRDAYVKDMEKFDFSLASSRRPCGRILFSFPNWFSTSLDVYDCFENTVAYLQSKEAYYPVELNPEDIADITVTNYHNELNEEQTYGVETRELFSNVAVADSAVYDIDTEVSETFFEQEEFEKIVPLIYPTYLSSAWNDAKELDDNYDIYVTFRKDTAYPYDRGTFGVYYKFYMGQVPQFVEEATALGAKDE